MGPKKPKQPAHGIVIELPSVRGSPSPATMGCTPPRTIAAQLLMTLSVSSGRHLESGVRCRDTHLGDPETAMIYPSSTSNKQAMTGEEAIMSP